jgi:hypothetical protein
MKFGPLDKDIRKVSGAMETWKCPYMDTSQSDYVYVPVKNPFIVNIRDLKKW